MPLVRWSHPATRVTISAGPRHSVLDYNNDGRLDVAVTGALFSSGSGGGYLIDGSNYASWDDTTDNLSDMATTVLAPMLMSLKSHRNKETLMATEPQIS